MGKDVPPPLSDKPAQKLVDPGLASAVANLSPAEANKVLELLEKALKRRKIQMWGYLLAGVVLILGFVGALYWYGLQPEGTFVGWVAMVPLGLCGVVLFTFGKWSERYRTAVETRFEEEQRRKKS
jgi:hypothetical protein